MCVVGQGDVEVSPVDAEVVAGTVEDILIARADGEDVEGCRLVARGDDLLAAIIDGKDGVGVEQDGVAFGFDAVVPGQAGGDGPGDALAVEGNLQFQMQLHVRPRAEVDLQAR